MKRIVVIVTANGRTKLRAVYPVDNEEGLANLLWILVRQPYREIRVTVD